MRRLSKIYHMANAAQTWSYLKLREIIDVQSAMCLHLLVNKLMYLYQKYFITQLSKVILIDIMILPGLILQNSLQLECTKISKEKNEN